jgi:hypothetical protein
MVFLPMAAGKSAEQFVVRTLQKSGQIRVPRAHQFPSSRTAPGNFAWPPNPFVLDIPEIEDLNGRLARTRLPDQAPGAPRGLWN